MRKEFQTNINEDLVGVEEAIKNVNNMYDEHSKSLQAEIETYTNKHKSIIDQQVKD